MQMYIQFITTKYNIKQGHPNLHMTFRFIVSSIAQYSQVIRIFDMLTSCHKTLSDHCQNSFVTQHFVFQFRVIILNRNIQSNNST